MLLFNEGAPLGQNGLKWLKVHCINKFGAINKAPFEEKVAYAEEHIDEILSSADDMCAGYFILKVSLDNISYCQIC